MNPKVKSVLITDLDNTLFDWVELWVRCFSAMLQKIVEISGLSAERLKSEIREVHRKHGTSEYSFLVEEILSLRTVCGSDELSTVFSPAFEAYRAERRQHLRLYPTVADSILKIKGSGAMIIGYTESMAFYSNYRVRRLGLDGVFDYIFSPEDHDTPLGLSREQIRKYPAAHYEFKYTKQRHTPKGSKKPDQSVLRAIISSLNLSNDDCVYAGDSLFKDVAMAQDAGVADVWAKYGQAHSRPEYDLLREVTHWSDGDVEREKKITERSVSPSYVLEESFSELLALFQFGDAHVS